jgi:hypothetical protein
MDEGAPHGDVVGEEIPRENYGPDTVEIHIGMADDDFHDRGKV